METMSGAGAAGAGPPPSLLDDAPPCSSIGPGIGRVGTPIRGVHGCDGVAGVGVMRLAPIDEVARAPTELKRVPLTPGLLEASVPAERRVVDGGG